MEKVDPEQLIHFDWLNINQKKWEGYLANIEINKEQDPHSYNVWNMRSTHNGREIDIQEFVQLQIETGSKARWWDCPKAWQKFVSQHPDRSKEHIQIMKNECPAIVLPNACMFCEFGHMTECHYPHNCNSKHCNHYDTRVDYYG